MAVVFVASQVIGPLHEALGYDLGNRTSTSLNDRLMAATLDPPGVAHLERGDLADDLSMARDFDLGITGPPMSYSMNFIADGLVGLVSGVASAIVLAYYGWWQAIVLVVAWSSTHWLLRESAIWFDRRTPEVMRAQRLADYSYRLAVDPPAAKEVRLFGLADWVIDRFTAQRQRLYDLQYEATRLRERSVAGALAIVLVANLRRALDARPAGRRRRPRPGGRDRRHAGRDRRQRDRLRRPQLGRSTAPPRRWPRSARWRRRWRRPAPCRPTVAAVVPAGHGPEIRFRDVSFGYPGGPLVLDGFDLTIPAGSSLAIVGQNGAGKTTLAKLLCRFYDPVAGAVEADGIDLRALDIDDWRRHVTAVFQDFVRFELPLRDNVAPGRRPVRRRRRSPPSTAPVPVPWPTLDTPLAKGYPGGTDLSGGQWQRVALARALAAVRGGAGVVLLDEPTAQLDVRGEAEIFERILAETRGLHDDPRVAPLLDRPPGRPHLRARARRGRRARHPRRADGARRPLPHDVRPPGLAVRGGRRARRGGRP